MMAGNIETFNNIAIRNDIIDIVNSMSDGKNLFDINDPDVTIGSFQRADGTILNYGGYGQTGFIQAEYGTNYHLSWFDATLSVTEYNEAKQPISGKLPDSNGVYTPTNSNVAYFRPVFRNINGFDIFDYSVTTDNERVVLVGFNDLLFTEAVNLFDPNANNTIGGYYNENGTYTSSSTLSQTDYIEVNPHTCYRTNSASSFVLEYDSSKQFINKITSIAYDNWKVARSSANTAYMKFIFATADLNNLEIKSSEESDKLIPLDLIEKKTEIDESKYSGMSGVAFGTSLTYRSQTTGGYLTRLQEVSGITFDNQGEGSCGFIQLGLQNSNITNRVMAYTDYASKDVCIIEGSVNDWVTSQPLGTYTDSGTSTVCGCLRECIKHVLTSNPSIQLMIVLDHYGATGTTKSSQVVNSYTQMTYYEELAKVCASLGIPCLKGYAVSGLSELTPYMFIDNIHLSALGVRCFGNLVYDFMKQYTPKVKE